ncbi:MAG TPA: ATP-dependent DNA helicase, partial [Xanthomonadaceae bacterium]|nr:ATP-dependent DNA helicase [Xanthomonadaceae bacterium]
IADYFARMRAAVGMLPTQDCLLMERFFDESGGTQLVIHSPYGSHVNRAWGLALRKRFCRKFNFELQAAATEDAIVLSLSTSHSFPLEEVARYLHSTTALDVLTQALLDAPLFAVRWRWNATTALALPRFTGGKKVAPQLQRMKSEDLLASVFPDQVACAENLTGEREIPDHPLVAQTLHDCLYEAMDAAGWLRLLHALESGDVQMVARDLTAPSPFAAEALSARPYAFLDDAPLEERRTQAVQARRYADIESADDLGRLDAAAIDSVRQQAWPVARTADEMHEALMSLGALTAQEADAGPGWSKLLSKLAKEHRATRLSLPCSLEQGDQRPLWIAAERLPQAHMLWPQAQLKPAIEAPVEFSAREWPREDALIELIRGRLGGIGPTPAGGLAESLRLPLAEIDTGLLRLESEGFVMRGKFCPDATDVEWCERHLLARIHRYTLGRLRREIEPVALHDFMRFLFDWQRVSPGTRTSGPEALAGVLAQLEGFEAAAGAWESELLPTRISDYSIGWLDELCAAGRIVWTRLRPQAAETRRGRGTSLLRSTPIVLLPRRGFAAWMQAIGVCAPARLSTRAQRVLDALAEHGASFFDELLDHARLLRPELEDALAELVSRGRIHSDSFAGLRALLVPSSKRGSVRGRGGRRAAVLGIEDAGRWVPIRRAALPGTDAPQSVGGAEAQHVEHVARVLLRRYGVMSWRLLDREAEWLPPWRELLRVYQRLEARGEIRGGRFIDGLSGQQFALPEAVAALRQVRNRPQDGGLVCVSGSDPLNLAGTLLPGEKLPRLPGSRVLYRDGVQIAFRIGTDITWLQEADTETTATGIRLLRGHAVAPHTAARVAQAATSAV